MQNVPKIVQQRLRAAAVPVNHPDADLLTAFAERSLPEVERAAVLEHMARCGDCRDIVALALPEIESLGMAVRPSASGWTWPALRWGFVAVGVVAIASFSIVQYQRHSQPSSLAMKQVATKQPPSLEVATNEPKKQELARFAGAVPAEKSDKAQSPPAPAFTDSAGSTTVSLDEKSEKKSAAGAETSQAPASAPTPVGANTSFRGAAVGGPLAHGPRLANQWPQQNLANNASNQVSVPPPSAFAKQQTTSVPSPNPRTPTTTQTAEVGGAAPIVTAQAEPPSNEADASVRVDRAKAAAPAASATEVATNHQDSFDHLERRSKVLQAAPGQIGGYVFDPSGAAVPNARITITPSNAGGSASVVTDSAGTWLIAGLPTGNYKAQAEAPGFKTTVVDLNYDANQPSMYSFTLNVGNVSETVEVAAQTGQLQTESTGVGVPMNGRDFSQLSATPSGLMPRWTISAAGSLQRSFDQGKTWQTIDVDASLFSSAFTSSSTTSIEIIAKTPQSNGSKEKASKEKDSGKAHRRDAATFAFRAVTAAGSDVWAGGSGGALYHSPDAGNHWTRIVPVSAGSALTGDIVSVDFPDPQHGKLATTTSEVWTTADSGQTWQKQ
jgi:hypothetical protein